MSNTDRDQYVWAELEQLSTTTPTSDYFAQALELGASPELLGRIASGYMDKSDDGYTITGLPYIEKLLAAGWSLASVREFLHDQCFSEKDTAGSHREGFWNHPGNWGIFDGDDFVTFMKEFAATYEGAKRVLTEPGHEKLEMHLGLWRHDIRQRDREVREIEAVATSHLGFLEDEYQVNKMIQFATTRKPKDQARMAASIGSWGWNLVFRGWVLANLRDYSYERSTIVCHLYRRLDELAVVIATYRWLVEGFYREHHEYWELKLEDSHVRDIFTGDGWHFLRVTQTPSGTLQVTLPGNGQRTIVQHVPGSEELNVGDEIMISRKQLEGLTPRTQPGAKVYQLTLSPARRPTPAMLADVRGQFWPKKK